MAGNHFELGCGSNTCCLSATSQLVARIFYHDHSEYSEMAPPLPTEHKPIFALHDDSDVILETLYNTLLTFGVDIWLNFSITLSCVAGLLWFRTANTESFLRLAVEFIAGTPLLILGCTILGNKVILLASCAAVTFGVWAWYQRVFQKAREWRQFDGGPRPMFLTLFRGGGNYITCLAILAVDFTGFPHSFRKTRHFGIGLMDQGLAFFVFKMGMGSKRARSKDLNRMWRVVIPLLVLGLARVVVIEALDYGHDEYEYGKHLNAFFILGFTKLFGTLANTLARSDADLLKLGGGLLCLHQVVQSLGLSDFVMSEDVERDNLFSANREGISSVPGFVAMFLIAQFYGRWMEMDNVVSYKKFMRKVKDNVKLSLVLWLLAILGILTVDIARVTCNFTFVVYTCAFCISIIWLSMLCIECALSTVWPCQKPATEQAEAEQPIVSRGDEGQGHVTQKKHLAYGSNPHATSLIQKAIDYNGLLYFLLSNFLTGGVNIFLNPTDRSTLEAQLILVVYMALPIAMCYVLYRYRIRIG